MKNLKLSTCGIATFLGLSIAACGGSPDIDQIKMDFENPSGDTSDKNSLIALSGKQAASGPTGVAGLSSSQGIGLSLTAEGKNFGFRRIAPRDLFKSEISYVRSIVEGRGRQHLTSAQAEFTSDACVDQAELSSALSSIDPVEGGSASFSYDIDLNRCTGGELTGKMSIDGGVDVSRTGGMFVIEERLDDVCETSGAKACVSGVFVIEMEMKIEEASKSVSMSMIAGWILDGSWDEDGKRREAHLKAGMRIKAEGSESFGKAALEYLFYLNTKDGEEVSFVLEMTTDSEGNTTLEIRGKDGKQVSCKWTSQGGSCSGTEGEISWDQVEQEAIYDEDWFMD